MSSYRNVRKILYGQPFDMGGMPIRQPFPAHRVEQIDPFLLLHHARLELAPGKNMLHVGVGPYPHRGFSSIIFLLEGSIPHSSSVGKSRVVYSEGVYCRNDGSEPAPSERPTIGWAQQRGK